MTTIDSVPDEIECAERVFAHIRPELLLTSPILRVPQKHQIHTVARGDRMNESLGDRWSKCGEHSTLMSVLASGVVPSGYYFDGDFETSPNYLAHCDLQQ